MPLNFHPNIGQILVCDFSRGFTEPEMVKSARPVIVISPRLSGRPKLVTVVCCSTVRPSPVQQWHWQLPKGALPQLGNFQEKETWLKGDMVYSVGFHRLEAIRLGKSRADGNRQYFTQRLSRESMKQVYSCVLHGMNLSNLINHL